MIKFSLAFLLGILILTTFESLPHWQWALCLVPIIFFVIRFPRYALWAGLLTGFLWALAHAHYKLHPSLVPQLEGQDLDARGQIVSLPATFSRSKRFEFKILEAKLAESGDLVQIPKKVRLNWYGKSPELQLGEIWQLRIRLKRPWGYANPGNFDYEKWLFAHEIGATGYVRTKTQPEKLASVSVKNPTYYLRGALHKKLKQSVTGEHTDVILALALGDRSEMTKRKWTHLTSTGTNHLLAISGLHIGIVSGLVFMLILRLWRCSERLCLIASAPRAAAVFAIIAAITYAMLAGFSIPTQRAMIMASVILLSSIVMKSFRPSMVLALALLAVLIWDPFSVLAPGFWLSFAAVAIIFLVVANNRSQSSKLWNLIKIQFALAIGLLPITLIFFQQASLLSPIANFFAVPWVSIVVVPLVLLGSLSLSIAESLGTWIVLLASYSIEIFWLFINYLNKFPYVKWSHAIQDWTLVPAIIGVMVLLLPRAWPAKLISLVLLCPLVFAQTNGVKKDQLKLAVLDVGQGLSVVVQSEKHTLVFDTGPQYSTNFNAGESLVIPYLREQAVDRLNMLIISHIDKDHAGGTEGVLNHIPVKRLISNSRHKLGNREADLCRAGFSWNWDAIKFEFLHPDEHISKLSKNNRSCVLRIEHPAGVILITGDIERLIERKLLETQHKLLDTDILIVPHHGSNSSSTTEFIQATSPEYAVFATGYRNPYKLPHKKVIERYTKQKSTLLNTAHMGMVSFSLSDHGIELHQGYREQRKKFWHSSSIH